MPWRRRACFAAGGLVGTYLSVSALMARGLTSSRRIVATDTPAAVGLDYEEITFPSAVDRLRLSGWLIRAPGTSSRSPAEDKWIVVVHGDSTNRTDPAAGVLGIMRDLAGRGYSMLAFDLRSCGESEGSRASAGFYERRDLLGALNYLASLGVSHRQAGVLGFSLGGAVALLVCARPGTAAAVVADSSFADLQMMMALGASGRRWPLSPFFPGMRLMSRIIYGIDIAAVSPARAISAASTPVFLIHGDEDALVPVSQARLIAKAATQSEASLWIAPATEHVQTYRCHPKEYISRVAGFFDTHLGG